MQTSLLASAIIVYGELVLRKDEATAADYETWERDHQMKYQLLLGCIVNTISSAEAQILRTSGLQLDVIMRLSDS